MVRKNRAIPPLPSPIFAPFLQERDPPFVASLQPRQVYDVLPAIMVGYIAWCVLQRSRVF